MEKNATPPQNGQNPSENDAPKKGKNYYVNNKETLLFADNAIENLTSQPIIREEMAKQGYGDEKVNQLKAIRDNAREKYQITQREGQEDILTRKTFEQETEILFEMYSEDRMKAKSEFRDEPQTQKMLAINGRIPFSFAGRIDAVKIFYRTLSENEELLNRTAVFMVNADRVATGTAQIEKVEKARSEYLREKGESQDATMLKNQAFKELDKALNKMFTIARIALKNNPQLLESLGKKV